MVGLDRRPPGLLNHHRPFSGRCYRDERGPRNQGDRAVVRALRVHERDHAAVLVHVHEQLRSAPVGEVRGRARSRVGEDSVADALAAAPQRRRERRARDIELPGAARDRCAGSWSDCRRGRRIRPRTSRRRSRVSSRARRCGARASRRRSPRSCSGSVVLCVHDRGERNGCGERNGPTTDALDRYDERRERRRRGRRARRRDRRGGRRGARCRVVAGRARIRARWSTRSHRGGPRRLPMFVSCAPRDDPNERSAVADTRDHERRATGAAAPIPRARAGVGGRHRAGRGRSAERRNGKQDQRRDRQRRRLLVVGRAPSRERRLRGATPLRGPSSPRRGLPLLRRGERRRQLRLGRRGDRRLWLRLALGRTQVLRLRPHRGENLRLARRRRHRAPAPLACELDASRGRARRYCDFDTDDGERHSNSRDREGTTSPSLFAPHRGQDRTAARSASAPFSPGGGRLPVVAPACDECFGVLVELHVDGEIIGDPAAQVGSAPASPRS